MLLAGLGSTLASELGLTRLEAFEADSTRRLDFGKLEPLVSLMQETSPDKLTPQLIEKLQSGTSLKRLVAAGALSNARTFGGQDYVGFHTFMALAPAFRMAQQLPGEQKPLPVLKVLHRNATRIQKFGGRDSEILHQLSHDDVPQETVTGEYLRKMSRTGNLDKADRAFCALSDAPIGEAFNHLQFAVEDEINVHRVVLAWRGWDTREIAGEHWGHTMLRQSIRFCANSEKNMIERDRTPSAIRTLLPKLLDEHKLPGRSLGDKAGDDTWLRELAETMFRGTREQAAQAVALALADGWSVESIGEAMSLAANMLVLHDPGRPEKWTSPGKPAGSCHGDSVGVHASDAANAWRNIARVSNQRNTVASLIVGAFHTAGQSDRSNKEPYPFAEHLERVKATDPDSLIEEADAAIRNKDQFHAAAAVARYGQLDHNPRAVFDLLLKYGTSQDGALHAEKYYQTVSEEFSTIRPQFRWGQLVALARVTASEYGYKSPGYEQAKELLKL
jgi:hypothetical protein